ncbi:MAG: hypothetical protein SGJ24_18910 [Chloroflexota bacterium]|nr:hypothetical protein [Chloroflexota bacterium]
MTSFLDRVTQWFPFLSTPRQNNFDSALDAARRARCADAFQDAHDHAERARGIARYPEQTADANFERARALIRLGRADDARALLDSLPVKVPGDRASAQRAIGLGELAAASADPDTARSHYELAVRLTSGARTPGIVDVAALARGLLAEAALADGGGRYATHLLNEALMTQTTSSDAALTGWLTGLLGEAMLDKGSTAEAARLLTAAANLSEVCGCEADHRRWTMRLGASAFTEGRIDVAYTLYSRALKDYAPISPTHAYMQALLIMCRVLLALPPESAGGRSRVEMIAYAEKTLTAAEALGDAHLIAEAHGLLGEALAALGKSADALPHLRAALSVPDAATIGARRALARATFDVGDRDAALALYAETAADADRIASQQTRRGVGALEAAALRRDWGLARLTMGDLNGAIVAWTGAIPLYESSDAPASAARLYCDIATARRALGTPARALKDIESALILVNSLPRDDAETRGVILANAALVYAESADAESADSFFKDAIAMAESTGDLPAHSTRLGNYGWFLLLIGRPRRARATLEQALVISTAQQLDPQRAIQTDNLGLVYDALGELPRALALHDEARTLTDDAAWRALFAANAAHTLITLNRPDEAIVRLDADPVPADAYETRIAAAIARGRALLALERDAAADPLIDEAVNAARKLDHHRLLAEALALRSRLYARRGDRAGALAAWDEAKKRYLLRHMPQGKLSPDWLTWLTDAADEIQR